MKPQRRIDNLIAILGTHSSKKFGLIGHTKTKQSLQAAALYLIEQLVGRSMEHRRYQSLSFSPYGNPAGGRDDQTGHQSTLPFLEQAPLLLVEDKLRILQRFDCSARDFFEREDQIDGRARYCDVIGITRVNNPNSLGLRTKRNIQLE